MKNPITNCILVGWFLFITSVTVAVPVVLSQVPAYEWYHGCGPTAAASVIGYWDLHGYPNLFDASGWDNVKLTANVQDQISSPEHNARYDPKPDDLTKPQSWNSIADWFRTSEDPLDFGWSSQGNAQAAFEGYAKYRGYNFKALCVPWDGLYGSIDWSDVVAEIDMGHPMMFLVDSNGDAITDHFVPVFGYDDRGSDGLWYALYTTWSEEETVVWQQFRPMSSGYSWGVGYATYVHPITPPIPEPATLTLLGLGSLMLVRQRR
jgi:hypothetical protein